MSADRWTNCHNCQPDLNDSVPGAHQQYSFREDYEIYAEYGEVNVSYSGHCRDCGYGTTFIDAHPIPPKEA